MFKYNADLEEQKLMELEEAERKRNLNKYYQKNSHFFFAFFIVTIELSKCQIKKLF